MDGSWRPGLPVCYLRWMMRWFPCSFPLLCRPSLPSPFLTPPSLSFPIPCHTACSPTSRSSDRATAPPLRGLPAVGATSTYGRGLRRAEAAVARGALQDGRKLRRSGPARRGRSRLAGCERVGAAPWLRGVGRSRTRACVVGGAGVLRAMLVAAGSGAGLDTAFRWRGRPLAVGAADRAACVWGLRWSPLVGQIRLFLERAAGCCRPAAGRPGRAAHSAVRRIVRFV